MEDGRQNLVVELIQAAVLAGAYGSLMREIPEATRGLGRMRAKWSERAATLADEISAGASDLTSANNYRP